MDDSATLNAYEVENDDAPIGARRPQTEAQKEEARSKRFAKKLRIAEMFEDRLSGMSYEAIGEKHHLTTSGAWKVIHTALNKIIQENADELIKMECARLDKFLAGLWPQAIKGDAPSVNSALRLSLRRAKLLGLDRPLKVDLGRMIDDIKNEYGLDDDEAAGLLTEMERVAAANEPEE